MSRRVLVTAAADGIGAATARAFVGGGEDVVLVDVDGERLAASTVAGTCLVADVTDEAAVTDLVAQTGPVDVLVNVVGGSRPGRTVAELGLAEWEDLLRLNLTSTFLLCRALIPPMEARGRGWVVNVSSGAGLRGMQRNPGYVAAKAGVAALTKALAIDHGPNGVRVNAVAPGPIRTPLMDRNRTPEEIAGMGRLSLTGRIGEPREVADVIVWLCSDAASYVLGQTIEVDGGVTTLI